MRLLLTLPRYLLSDLGKAFAMSLAVYSFVFLALMCSQVISNGVSMPAVLQIIPYIFPLISRLVLPLAVVTAILIAYGRFTANNEMVAAQAAGIHPFWLGAPGMVLALFASMITVYLNADVLTASVVNMERRILADRTNIINAKLEKPGSFSFQIPGSITLAICRLPSAWNGESGNQTGIDFAVFKSPEANAADDEVWDPRYPHLETRTLAKNHQIKVTEDDDGNMSIIGDFWDAIVFNRINKNLTSIQLTPHTRDKFVHPNGGFEVTFDPHRVQYMGIDKLLLEMAARRKKVAETGERFYQELRAGLTKAATGRALPADVATWLAATTATTAEIAARNPVLAAEWAKVKSPALASEDYRIGNWRGQSEEAHWSLISAMAEVQVKLVMSFACVSFAFLGIPLASSARCGNSTIGYAAGLGFAFIFYMVVSMLFNSVRNGTFPWYSLWVPNLAMMLAGGYWWFRATRY
ncbi:hypothetical protein AGMMS49959_18660 [Planctomycetales bacterium]|nr:hypothetical protein AGMMS49959_18660 [Planctomycetales bacterium]